MNLKQIKAGIVEDLRHQLFRRSRPHTWTAEHYYIRIGSVLHGTPEKVAARAIEELIAEGKIKRRMRQQDGKDFPVLELIELIPHG